MQHLYPDHKPGRAGTQREERRWPMQERAPRLEPWADPFSREQAEQRPGRFDRQIEADVLRNFARIGV